MEGLFVFSHVMFPEKAVRVLLEGRPNAEMLVRKFVFGFYMAKIIVGLYTIEIMLKYAHQEIDKRGEKEIRSRRGHDIVKLFRDLPKQERRNIEIKYEERAEEILREGRAKEVMSLRSLIRLLKGHPITDMRYFWERPKGERLLQYHGDMEAFSYGIAIGACGYPDPNKP